MAEDKSEIKEEKNEIKEGQQSINLNPLMEQTIMYLETQPFREVEGLIAAWRQILAAINKKDA